MKFIPFRRLPYAAFLLGFSNFASLYPFILFLYVHLNLYQHLSKTKEPVPGFVPDHKLSCLADLYFLFQFVQIIVRKHILAAVYHFPPDISLVRLLAHIRWEDSPPVVFPVFSCHSFILSLERCVQKQERCHSCSGLHLLNTFTHDFHSCLKAQDKAGFLGCPRCCYCRIEEFLIRCAL